MCLMARRSWGEDVLWACETMKNLLEDEYRRMVKDCEVYIPQSEPRVHQSSEEIRDAAHRTDSTG